MVSRKVTKLRNKTPKRIMKMKETSLFDSLLEEAQKPSGPVTTFTQWLVP